MPVEGDAGFLEDPLVKSESCGQQESCRGRRQQMVATTKWSCLGNFQWKTPCEDAAVQVIQPNEDDGSYWRKIVRNKVARMQERKREQAAADFVQQRLSADTDIQVQSTWGPYTTTSGTAKSTAVPLPSPKTTKKKHRRAKKQQQQQPKPVVATSPSNLERILQEQSTVGDEDEMYVLVSANDLQQVIQQRRIQANQAEIRRIPTTRFVEESPLFPRSARQWAGRRS